MKIACIFVAEKSTTAMNTRINRSKYNFSKLDMGDTFFVQPLDLYSMKNSLRFYNKKHKQNITVSTQEEEDGRILVTRVPVKVKSTVAT